MVAVMSALSTEGLVWAAVLVWAGLIGLAIAQPPGVDIDAEAIAPTEKLTLYDGTAVNDLRHFYTWLGPQGYDDPNGVFSVAEEVDGNPAIRVTGAEELPRLSPRAGISVERKDLERKGQKQRRALPLPGSRRQQKPRFQKHVAEFG